MAAAEEKAMGWEAVGTGWVAAAKVVVVDSVVVAAVDEEMGSVEEAVVAVAATRRGYPWRRRKERLRDM